METDLQTQRSSDLAGLITKVVLKNLATAIEK